MDAAASSTAAAGHKRLFGAASSGSAPAKPDEAQAARDAIVAERRALEATLQTAPAATKQWSEAAIRFAQTHLQDAAAWKEFRQLCELMQQPQPASESKPQEERKEAPTPITAPILPLMSNASVSVAPPILPMMDAPQVAAAVSSPPAAASPIASSSAAVAAAVAPTAAPAAAPTDLLATIYDVSLLVPRGKYQLQLSSEGACFAVPATPAKSLSFSWTDVAAVFDLADVNKRDWLVVISLKRGSRGLQVGKQTHHAVVIKMLATEKIKKGRVAVAPALQDATLAQVQTQMQTLVDAHTGANSLFNNALVGLLREVPALRSAGVPFVSHDASIFSSQKGLPCVGCKLGVEDGSLYFLRTGLLFIKPVLYLPLADLDGITPARGMSSTFDMKVGQVGTNKETAFIMIDPKEEANITRYCAFLAQEQNKMEKKEKRDKLAAAAAASGVAPAPSSSAAAAASSSSVAAAAGGSSAPASSSPIVFDDADMADQPSSSPPALAPAAGSGVGGFAEGLSAANIIAGPRPHRRAKPKSFVGMEDEDETSAAAPTAAAAAGAPVKPAAAAGDAAAAGADNDEASEEEEDWADASDSSSDDSAEYDSAEDEKSIHSSDDEAAPKGKQRAAAESSDDEEQEDESMQE